MRKNKPYKTKTREYGKDRMEKMKKSAKPSLLIANEHGLEGGGAEKRIKLLLKELLKRKLFSRILFMHSSDELKHLKDIKKLDGVQLPNGTSVKFFYYGKNEKSGKGQDDPYRAAKVIIKEFAPDIIQFHNLGNVMVLRALAESKAPMIFVAHDYWPLCGKRCFIDPFNAEKRKLCHNTGFFRCVPCIGLRPYLKTKKIQKLMKKVNAGISPTRKTIEIYEQHGVLVGKWKIVTPWIDVELFAPDPKIKRNNDILFVGSLMDYKGAGIIAKAFAKISKEIPNSRLLFIGPYQGKDSIFRKRIEAIAEKGGFTGRVLFLGHKSWREIAQYHRKCGVYVCPPIWPELFGLNWAEAMAAGCPVVASAIGAIPEFINDKDRNGLIFRSGDHEDLAHKVILVLENKSLAEQLSRNGAAYAARHFSIKKNVEDIVRLYRQLLR